MSDRISDFLSLDAPEEPEEYGARIFRTRIRPEDWEPSPEALAAGRGPGGPVLIGAFESNTTPWYEARATRIGGSEIGGIVGISKYASAYTIWHSKVRARQGEFDVLDSPAIEWGHRLEEAVGAKLVENHPDLELLPQVGSFEHSERPWQIANPDLLGPTAVGEVKTAGYASAWGEPGTDQVPLTYRAQVQWYMDVLGLDVAHVCVLVSGSDYREYVVPYDLADALWMREQGEAFVKSLADGVEPDPDGGQRTLDLIEAQGAAAGIEPVDVQIDSGVARSYEDACRAYNAAKAEKNLAVARVLKQVGSGRRAMVGTTPIASRAKTRYGTTYLRIDGSLLETTPADPPPTPSSAPTGHIEDHLDWLLQRCTAKTQVVALVDILGARLSDEGMDRARRRYNEVG